MIRKATLEDVEAIGAIYDAIHTQEEAGEVNVGWKRDVYPTRETAAAAIEEADDMYVMTSDEDENILVAAARINQVQVPEYIYATWSEDVPDDKVMVLHTLVVDPAVGGHGYGTRFVAFYEQLAAQNGCTYLRMDTNERNMRARLLYKKLGFTEHGIIPCVFNGIEGVMLVCLEKKVEA